MGKFKQITANDRVSVRQKLSSGESLNVNETSFFSRVYVKGIMRPTVEDKKKLLYIGAVGVPLIKFIGKKVNRGQFFMIVAETAEVMKKTTANNLRPENLVFDTENIIINPRTGDLFFIYQPVNGAERNIGFIPFLRQLVNSCSFDSGEDTSYVNNFVGYLNSLRSFSMQDFERYIYGVSPSTHGVLQRMGYISVTPAPQPAPVQSAPQQPVQQPVQRPAQQPVQPVQQSTFARPAAPASQPVKPAAAPAPQPVNPAAAAVSAGNDVAQQIIKDINAGSAKLKTSPAPSLLNEEDEGTMLLSDFENPTAKLRRRSNGDEVTISSDTFRIGKDSTHSDYCVAGNKTISRQHAVIKRRNGEFYFIDNGSTNKSYVNGTVIPANTERKLASGDVIKLSNEEFVFTR
ncbi:MAG: FHA domain-containing protein [Ruminococcus sp.]|nr:FHA domain-containing protein [Ruminococcus sp.]